MADIDQKLIQKAQRGDRRAFGKLVKKYRNKVLYLAYDLLGNYDDAQDVAQSVFLRVFSGIRNFKGKSSFSTWLYRITVNLSIDFKRSKYRRSSVSIDKNIRDEDDPMPGKIILRDKDKDPLERLEIKDLNEQIENALDTLSEQQREAFVLRHYHGMSMDEISKILECKPGTVRSHLFRAINKLREYLKEDENMQN